MGYFYTMMSTEQPEIPTTPDDQPDPQNPNEAPAPGPHTDDPVSEPMTVPH
ncbi:MAG: hypothetical protein JWQ32_581 [Marmoricola sp.]|nr:hypothetical protein [Marmoricola sp.]